MGQDIFCFMETHIGEKEQNLLELKGYRNLLRSQDVQSNGVYYDGLCLYIKSELQKGVIGVQSKDET